MTDRQNSRRFLLLFLGVLSAFGPFIMDMYLPTLPAMADFFHTSSSMVQLGLTTSMIGLAAGQLIFGPLSDKYGRRPPLLLAMILFLLATVGCIFSHTISQFVTSRFLQGIAGAGGVVISRSIATDEYSGQQLAGMLARYRRNKWNSYSHRPYRRRYTGSDNKLARHLYLLILYGSGSPIRKLTFERITSGKTQTDCELARLIP